MLETTWIYLAALSQLQVASRMEHTNHVTNGKVSGVRGDTCRWT